MSQNIWDKVAYQFGEKGPRYWNRFGERLVELSSIQAGESVLDLGMGRGASLFPAAKRVGDSGHVTGIDASIQMVEATRGDIQKQKLKNILVLQGDATRLPFAPDSFDHVLCGFGLGIFLQEEHPFWNILSVLKVGGEAGFSIWGVQADQMWFTRIVNHYLGAPKDTKIEKQQSFDTPDTIGLILETAGFANVRIQEEDSLVIYENKNAWWDEMQHNAGAGILSQVEALGNQTWEAFRQEVNLGLEDFDRGDGLYVHMPVIYAFGEKQDFNPDKMTCQGREKSI